jgi:hypothetical protein
MLSSSHFDDVVTFEWIKILHPCWHRGIEFVADSELTMVVEAPREKLVLVIYVKTVLIPAKNVNGSFCANLLDLESLMVLVTRVQHAAYLS